MKRLFFVIAAVLFAGDLFCQELVINELMARNTVTITDQDDEYDDWVELYNGSNHIVSLGGYFLSDDADELCQWVFPDTSILPQDYLVIWSDGDINQTGLHTGFRLSSSGESLYLTDTDSSVVDFVAFPRQDADISWGRFPDGSGEFRTMVPTFGQSNRDDDPGSFDPSEALFRDGVIHKFELQFYTDNWQDSLKYYFENLDEEYIPTRLIYNDSLSFDSIGVRYKGNSSYMLSGATKKKPLKFRFDKYLDDQQFFGLTRLNFSNCISDPSFMREKLAYDIARRYMPAPRTSYADIYANNELIGFYVMVEQVDRFFLQRYFEDDQGCLVKAGNNGANLFYRGGNVSDYESGYDMKSERGDDDWQLLIDMIDKLNHAPSEDFINEMETCLNLDNCIRHLAFNMVLSHFDSYIGSGRNYYLYYDTEVDQFSILPWDLNETFGVYTNNWNVITQDVICTSSMSQKPLFHRIMENDSLRSVYLAYIEDMITGLACTDSVTAVIERIKPLIDLGVLVDDNKLYSYQDFLNNIEQNVRINYGKVIPGLISFSRERNLNLEFQLTAERVYPGDTDNHGIVDEYDILPIGVFFEESGNSRSISSFDWGAHLTLAWGTPAATYADANGDGVIDETDVIGIGYNWNCKHTITTNSYEIDITDPGALEPYEDIFRALYEQLPIKGESGIAIKTLLETVFGFSENPPEAFVLSQNYPNPFNSKSMISFTLPEEQQVTLWIYNACGQLVLKPIAEKHYAAGQHALILNASDLSSGFYVYRIQTGSWNAMRGLTILK